MSVNPSRTAAQKLSKNRPPNTASTSLQLSRPATPWPHRIPLVGVSTQELFYGRADVVDRSTVSQFDQGCLSDHGDPQLRALHRMASPQSVEVCLAFFGELGVATTSMTSSGLVPSTAAARKTASIRVNGARPLN